jgi:hypothetical protein
VRIEIDRQLTAALKGLSVHALEYTQTLTMGIALGERFDLLAEHGRIVDRTRRTAASAASPAIFFSR